MPVEELHITLPRGGITHNNCPREELRITVTQGELHITLAQGRNYT